MKINIKCVLMILYKKERRFKALILVLTVLTKDRN